MEIPTKISYTLNMIKNNMNKITWEEFKKSYAETFIAQYEPSFWEEEDAAENLQPGEAKEKTMRDFMACENIYQLQAVDGNEDDQRNLLDHLMKMTMEGDIGKIMDW